MADNPGLVAALLEKIRADSARTALTPSADLASLVPGGFDAVTLLEENAEADIKIMHGTRDCYYFSERSMTESYARHLYRLAEKDPVRLIADTTRDESKTYPRSTPVLTFEDSPFSMTNEEINAAISKLTFDPEYADIRTVHASNGDAYLNSTTYLSESHATGLAEWASVGEKENP